MNEFHWTEVLSLLIPILGFLVACLSWFDRKIEKQASRIDDAYKEIKDLDVILTKEIKDLHKMFYQLAKEERE